MDRLGHQHLAALGAEFAGALGMTAREIKRRILYEAGADSMPGPKLVRRRAYWHLWAAWMGWAA